VTAVRVRAAIISTDDEETRVRVVDVDGVAHDLATPSALLDGDWLEVGPPVATNIVPARTLIEFPQIASTGKFRAWIAKENLRND
jgi:hypothetical protein